jgi:hypothetical protein
MADKAIYELPAAETVQNEDLLVLEQGGVAKKLSGELLGDYVYAAAAEKIDEVNQAVADAQTAVNALEAQKDTIAQTIEAMADLGTDTTLSTTGMAADAKVTGDKISRFQTAVSDGYSFGIEAASGFEPVLFERGFYYSTPAEGSVSEQTTQANWWSAKRAITEGEKITVLGASQGSSQRLYAFLNSSSQVISRSGLKNYGTYTDTAPENAAYVVFNIQRNLTEPNPFYAFIGSGFLDYVPVIDSAIKNGGVINSTSGISTCDNAPEDCFVFVSSSGGTSAIADFPLSGAGWLLTIRNASQAMQIAYPWNLSQKQKYRVRQTGTWTEWETIQGDASPAQGDTYNNTYNITTTPSITTDTNGWLQPVDTDSTTEANATDMTGPIMSMLTDTGYCHLAPGVYWISGNIDLPAHATLEGCGRDTVIKLLSSVTSGYCIKTSQQCCIKDLYLTGGDTESWKTSSIGTRHGIYYIANADGQEAAQTPGFRNIIDNVYIHGFSGNGIYQHNTGGGLQQGIVITNCFIQRCTVGINIDYYSEYAKYIGNVIFACYYACINNGGNNVFSDCTFHGKVGFVIDNSSETKRNNAHGSAVGCTFNHINNTDADGSGKGGDAVVITNVTNGFVFTGCQIWYGAIKITSGRGIQFSDCLIGGDTPVITITGDSPTFFSSCLFHANPTITTGSSGSKFDNCYNYSGTAISG